MPKERKETLYNLGASDEDMIELLNYTKNEFHPYDKDFKNTDDDFLKKWNPIIETSRMKGEETAINQYLAKEEFQIRFMDKESLHIELYPSIAGTIPLITTESKEDFESMVRNVVYKGKDVPHIDEMGAMFAFGKINRFIILSDKPYSNVTAERMGLSEHEWRQKSFIIRREHECTHYYTKRYFGSSKNNLQDELIADFNGIYTAFHEYRAEWFLKFLGLSEDSDGIHGRIKVYTNGMSSNASKVIERLAIIASNKLEAWSKTEEFFKMSETERVEYLCKKDLLSYAESC